MTDQPKEPLELLGILAMSTQVRIYAGAEIPHWFDATFRRDGLPTAIQVRVTVSSDGRLILSGVMAFGDFTYRDAINELRGQPLDDLMHQAADRARLARDFQDFRREQGIKDGEPFTLQQQQDLELKLGAKTEGAFLRPLPQPTRQRRVATTALLREVADIYRTAFAAGKAPTAAVAAHFSVSHRTGTRWVAEARKEGFLGPALGPTAGEADAPNASE
jgi:hypothetical protein